jgi:predicted metal-dependent enzyme (double-stranded beta helix superfamily)
MRNIQRLRDFIIATTHVVAENEPAKAASAVQPLLRDLVAQDDWLPEDYRVPHPDYYQQYLLHADPLERFSVVSFVWGPGQKTPVHDHRVWGLVGILHGAELSADYSKAPDGSLTASAEERLLPGQVIALTPETRDIHSIRNAFEDQVSISVHVYGGNIGAVSRAVFDAASGQEKPFVSGYSNDRVPNLWDRSAEVRRSLVSPAFSI